MFYPEGESVLTGACVPGPPGAGSGLGLAHSDLRWTSSVRLSSNGYAFEVKLSEDDLLSISAFSEEYTELSDKQKPTAPLTLASAAASFPLAVVPTEESPASALRFERIVNKEEMDTYGFDSRQKISVQMQTIVDALRGSDALLTAALIPCVVPRMEASRWGLERLSEMDSSIGAEAVDEKGGEEQAASAEPTALLLRVTEDTRGGALHYYILMFAEQCSEAQLLKREVWKLQMENRQLKMRVKQLEKEKKQWQAEGSPKSKKKRLRNYLTTLTLRKKGKKKAVATVAEDTPKKKAGSKKKKDATSKKATGKKDTDPFKFSM